MPFVRFEAVGNTPAERDKPAVGRNFGGDATATRPAVLLFGLAPGDFFDFARLQIQASQLRAAEHRIGMAKGKRGTELHIEIQIFPVPGDGMPSWRLVFANELNSGTAVPVVHDQRPIEFRAALGTSSLALDND